MEEKKKAPVAREQTTVRMPEELKDKVYKKANERGISFNAMLIIAIQKGLEFE